ncbi:MAG TPA: hypothetical protein DDY31_09260 [Lachnospiraceae bacterium]|nr:hypothetical protein [Lachnospiraceae bacterium]
MDQIAQEFVLARMEELEVRLRNDEEYWKQAKIANQAGKKFEDACDKGEGILKAYGEYEEELSKTNCIYSEEAYKLGFEDGISIGMEKEPDGRKSVLSLEDMTAMVSVYDSVQVLKEAMLGSRKEYWEEGGVLAVFDSVYDIVEHAVCAEIWLLGDEAAERVTEILDREEAAEERAKLLLGII